MLVRRPALALAIAAAVLLAPSLLVGTLISHSSAQNLTWAAQFADLFRTGIVYPRWLPESFDGLGSPTFYFYPPIAFWIDALVSAATFDTLSVSHRLSLSSLVLLWASGLAMHAWLKAEAPSRRAALYGALAYPFWRLDTLLPLAATEPLQLVTSEEARGPRRRSSSDTSRACASP